MLVGVFFSTDWEDDVSQFAQYLPLSCAAAVRSAELYTAFHSPAVFQC